MKKWILISVLALLLIAGGVGFYILSIPPKEKLSQEFKKKAVGELLGRKAKLEADNTPIGDKEFKGKYITFKYPAKALEYPYKNKDSKDGPAEESFSFDIRSPKLVFNMKSSPYSQSLDDIPSVRLREQRSYEYKKTEITVQKTKGAAYFKGGFEPEKSGFFVTNGRIYTISVSGVVEKEVENLFDEVVSTVSFL